MKKASRHAEETERAYMRILNSIVEGNAEHAMARQQATEAATSLALHAQNLTGELDTFIPLLVHISSSMEALRQRQDDMDAVS